MMLSFFLFLLVLLLVFLIFRPLLNRKFKKPARLSVFKSLIDVEKIIIEAGKEMLTSDKVFMSFTDEESLYTELARIKSKVTGSKKGGNYAYYNFPRAFLAIGLLEYAKTHKDKETLKTVIEQSEKLIDKKGNLKFEFDKIDQALFGLLFVKLFKETAEIKYKNAADEIYKRIQEFKTHEGLYLYRKDTSVLFVDTLGMLPPFLLAYATIQKDDGLKEEAFKQIGYYLNKTVENDYRSFPCHAYDLENEIRLGSTNWTRGIGWFMIGLSHVVQNSDHNNHYLQIYNHYLEKLQKLKLESGWAQFLGHTNDKSIDASATIMLYYAQTLVNPNNQISINQALNQSIDVNGFVINNSGDTIYINKYSRVKGKSELSQGLLINILAHK